MTLNHTSHGLTTRGDIDIVNIAVNIINIHIIDAFFIDIH